MVTTLEFINALKEVYISKKNPEFSEDFHELGKSRGWIDSLDTEWLYRKLERRQAARIIHEFLRIEFGLQDTRDWSHANRLKDLYDCRVCAKHVAQVVERGIMKPLEPDRFMLLRPVSENDVAEFIDNMRQYM